MGEQSNIFREAVSEQMSGAREPVCIICSGPTIPIALPWGGHQIPPQCDKCVERQNRADARRKRQERWGRWYTASGVPERELAEALRHYPDPHPKLAMIRHGDRPCAALLIGKTGTGKTASALAWMGAQAERHEERHHGLPQAVYIREDELLTRLAGRHPEAEVARLRIAQYVIIDDIGRNPGAEWARRAYSEVLCHRHDWQMPTVFTSNFGPRELLRSEQAAVWDVRMMDRVLRMCGGFSGIVELDDVDWRTRHTSDEELEFLARLDEWEGER